jgi:hypothetical protein
MVDNYRKSLLSTFIDHLKIETGKKVCRQKAPLFGVVTPPAVLKIYTSKRCPKRYNLNNQQ